MERVLVILGCLLFFFIKEGYLQQCENIITNSDFSLDDVWIFSEENFDASFVQEDGRSSLRLEPLEEGTKLAVQTVAFDDYSQKSIFVEVVGKIDSITSGSPSIGPFILLLTDKEVSSIDTKWMYMQSKLGEGWVTLSSIITPTQDYNRIRVQLSFYNGLGVAFFDSIKVCQLDSIDYTFTTELGTNMIISSSGNVKSINDAQGNSLFEKQPSELAVSTIYLKSGGEFKAYSFAKQEGENDQYLINYLSSTCEVKMEVLTGYGHISFEILSIENCDTSQINKIEFVEKTFNLYSKKKEDIGWTIQDTDTIVNTVGLDDITSCHYYYHCYAFAEFGLVNSKMAFIIAQAKDYYYAHEKILIEGQFPDVPYFKSTLTGDWVRKTPYRTSYLFSSIGKDYIDTIYDYVERSKFKKILLPFPTNFGTHSETTLLKWDDIDDLAAGLQRFRDIGIKFGFHYVSCRILDSDPYFDIDKILKEDIATLSSNIDSVNAKKTFTVDIDLENDERYVQVRTKQANEQWILPYFRIDNEIFQCEDVVGNTLSNCERGMAGTAIQSHSSGTTLYWVFASGYPTEQFFIDHTTDLAQKSIDGFANFANKVGVNWITVDGAEYPAKGENSLLNNADQHFVVVNGWNHCLRPRMDSMDEVEYMNIGQHGPMNFFITATAGTYDGVCENGLGHTRSLKLPLVLEKNDYTLESVGFEWWRVHGAEREEGSYTYDATSHEEIHYLFTKMITTERPVGLQLSCHSYLHEGLEDLMDLIGVYNEFIENDIKNSVMTKASRQYYSEPEREIELIDGKLIEKTTIHEYSNWNLQETSSTGTYEFTINNPYDTQPVNLRIIPRFDFFEYNSNEHQVINDMSSVSSFIQEDKCLGSDCANDFSCSISNGGRIQITNNGVGTMAGCTFELPGTNNYQWKRGIGVDITGDGSGIEIEFKIAKKNQFGSLSFSQKIDFTGRKQLLLGKLDDEAVKCPKNVTYGTWNQGCSNNGNHVGEKFWGISTNDELYLTIVVHIEGPNSADFTIHEIKLIKEKNYVLKNPQVSINGEEVTFDTTLNNDKNDEINHLEYSGDNKKMKLYSVNRKYFGEENVDTPNNFVLKNGENKIQITSDMQNPDDCFRAEYIFTLYGNEINKDIDNENSIDFPEWIFVVAGVAGTVIFVSILIIFISIFILILVKKRKHNDSNEFELN